MTHASPYPDAPIEPFVLPRDEMAFRGRYQGLLLDRKITTVFRPGDRVWPSWRGYIEGETVTARVIERSGCDELRVAPRFNRIKVPIRIRDLTVFDADALEPEDFEGSSPDVQDRDSLLAHLFDIYGKPIEAFGGKVTRIRFAYAAPRWPGRDRRR